jgi:tRNA dimethylallyltransferase
MTLDEYQRLAYTTISEIQERDCLPILVGGTGQYVKAVVEGWGIPAVVPNPGIREQLLSLGGPELARWLDYLDPKSADRIHPRNLRRIIRALEVILISGRRMSDLQKKSPPGFDILMIGLTCDRETLYKRIDARIDRMMTDGLLEEIVNLQKAGYGRQMPAMNGLGYAQLHAYIDGELSLEEAVQRAKYETHRFVRQQYTWFRPGDSVILWFNVEEQGWKEKIERTVLESYPKIGQRTDIPLSD